ncbi:MAG: FtsL-like putative cell division protein [Bacteroidia bacterium]|nr:FtsL-like putative cell division protein [Bacteroidia bacterium]
MNRTFSKIGAARKATFKATRNLATGKALLWFDRNRTFSIFLAALALLYVWNAHDVRRRARRIEEVQERLKEYKSEYMTLNAELSVRKKQSSVRTVVDSIGLKPLTAPPFKLDDE